MKFILFRHAHKGLFPLADPELSPEGRQQALRISKQVKKPPTRLYVSPKKRASQTFYPLSVDHNLSLTILPDLDQQNPLESRLDFKKRIQYFLQMIEDSQVPESVVFACTHYDWIEESMALINCDKSLNSFEFSHWSPCQYMEFEVRDTLWKFTRKGSVV